MAERFKSGGSVMSVSAAPEDEGHMAYWILFFQGIANLFPWNAFIMASAYFAQRFCGTEAESSFENHFSVAYNLSQTIGLALTVLYQERMSMTQLVTIPLSMNTVIFAFTTVLVVVQDISGDAMFALTLISVFLSGFVGSIIGGGLFKFAGFLPTQYTGAIMSGQGLGGLIVSISAVVTLAASPAADDCDDDGATDDGDCDFSLNYSALAYFLVATGTLGVAVFLFLLLKRMPISQFFQKRAERKDLGEAILSPIISDNESSITRDEVSGLHLQNDMGSRSSHGPTQQAMNWHNIQSCFRQVAIPAASVFGTYAISIGIFPVVPVLIESTQKCESSNRLFNDLFVPMLFLVYTLADFLGRTSAGVYRNVFTAKNIWIGAAARVIFFPALMLCNIPDSRLPAVFHSDAFPYLFLVLMGFSSGYVANISMMLGPSLVKVQDAGLAGTIMVFSLTCGLVVGSGLSFLVVFILRTG